MSNIWNLLLFQPILNLLVMLYRILFSNLGLAIIVLTLLIRLILIPITNPQLESAKKMQKLAPELDKLKKKFKDDKQKLMQAQMELYKRYGVNPASGCLPQIIQMLVLIALYQVFNKVIKINGLEEIQEMLYSFNNVFTSPINFNFLYLNLTKPDLFQITNSIKIPGLFVILATAFQFLSSKLMAPKVKKEERIAKKTEEKSDDIATTMQSQMLYLFPMMTLVFGYTMPSGVMLYWFVFSLSSYVQQAIINKKHTKEETSLIKN